VASNIARGASVTRIDESQFVVGERSSYSSVPPPPTNGFVSSAGHESATIIVGTSSGYVNVTAEALDREPEEVIEQGWEDIVEVDLHATTGDVIVMALMEDPPELPGLTPHGPGNYRLRVHAAGRDQDFDMVVASPVEEYLIQSWPITSPLGEIVHKRS
jgi:hypothetical protein